MNPREPELLNDLLRQAERTLKAPSVEPTARWLLEEYEDELKLYAGLTSDSERVIDDTAIMLAQCLRNAEREGPFGAALLKWQLLARAFLPFVRTDAARAMNCARPRSDVPDYVTRARR